LVIKSGHIEKTVYYFLHSGFFLRIKQWRKIIPALLCILMVSLSVILFFSCKKTYPPDKRECLSIARQFLSYLIREEYANAVLMFNSVMKGMLPEEKLKNAWEQILEQVGRYENEIYAATEEEGQFVQVFITGKFTNVPLDIKFVFTPNKEISGLWFLPAYSSYDSYKKPDYAVKESFREEEAVFGLPEWRLPGTLSIPAETGRHPALILVHGSGPHDRDETIGPNKPFKDIAWGLASRGIAVFRYEKRTHRYPSKSAANKESFTVRQETIDDVLEAVSFLKKRTEIDPRAIFILGHSLGGMLIPKIALRAREAAGFIIMAGPARPLEQLLLEQTIYLSELDGVVTDAEKNEIGLLKQKIAKLKQGDIILETKPDDLPLGIPAVYWLDLKGYVPQAVAAEINRPFLILQGGRDYQVTAADFQLWQQALGQKENVTFRFYESLNHLFISGVGKSKPAEYFDPSHVEEIVIEDMARWITDVLKSRQTILPEPTW
jgi:dienelactone hydrolase